MTEKPNWQRGDTLKSLHATLNLGSQAVKTVIGSLAERIDTKYSDQLNGDSDE